jgi:hypothetical protein
MENAARPTIHHSELGPAQAGSPITQEWDVYRREVGRLIAEGHEGKWVLIKGEEIIGLFDNRAQAMDMGYDRFLGQPFLVKQILTREPVSRVSCHRWSCPTSP